MADDYRRLYPPLSPGIPVRDVEVGAADAGMPNRDQHFARPRSRLGDGFHGQARGAAFFDDRLHGGRGRGTGDGGRGTGYKLARSDARNTTAAANSSGVPIRPTGVSAMRCLIMSGRALESSSMRSVAMNPGQTLFTVMPSLATSSDSALANPRTPARAVDDRIKPGSGCSAAIDARQMMRPHRALVMIGTAALASVMVEIRFSSIAFGQASAGKSLNAPAGGPPALAKRMSSRPNLSATSCTSFSACAGTVTSAGNAAVLALRPFTATLAPSCSSIVATARPRPRVPPHTSATRPLRPRSMVVTQSGGFAGSIRIAHTFSSAIFAYGSSTG